ncbi:unnamed protein product [Leptidea sinapis]|uniref:Short-chain dehydrogenase n=1 Tax=Leptidea sinapis TaxID=189913 RepID=A0A5E4QH80_9NEOP|nr:unnamed protein product [Leptidea sinapis]
MNTVLITGANRGLGLGMVKFLIENKKAGNIFATCRKTSEELKSLSEVHDNLHILNLDVTNTAQYNDIAEQVSKISGEQGLNLLINNAGITTKFTKLNLVKPEQLMENFTINTVAPILLTKAALNAATKSMSIDLKKEQILVASMHPGWVKTDMGGKNAPLDVATSVRGIFDTIGKLREEDNGKFFQYDGSELPW